MGSSKALQAKRYRAFRERLRLAREEAGLTQAEVAERVGRPQTWVSKCELGERRVDFVELEDFAAACGKPLLFFRTRDSDVPRRR
jgi:transcriptional regulator with XRE-family HTH domain